MEKMLACGDTGSGAMQKWEEIVEVIEKRLALADNKDENLKSDA
jgi:phosphopantothenoylcysteine decarboxylase